MPNFFVWDTILREHENFFEFLRTCLFLYEQFVEIIFNFNEISAI